jgi:hypothetical protein
LLHGDYKRGTGKPNEDTGYVLVYASLSNFKKDRPNTIGTMLHRKWNGQIFRPTRTIGWFWLHEINAAKRAKLIDNCHIFEWMSYDPCGCKCPMDNVRGLYDQRNKVGKDTPLGKGCKLAYNSMYGKFAQSVGKPLFANPIWASLITAGCRTMILDAIATHPKGKDDVCMVATDAVFFCTPHPTLPISNKLGEWDHANRNNLTLFKPGVYWDDNTRRDINENRVPIFKARGIAAADFASKIEEIDEIFREWNPYSNDPALSHDPGILEGWPYVEFESGFSMVSCLQAIRRHKWETAGSVLQDNIVAQNANPYDKRIGPYQDVLDDGRIIWRSVAHALIGDYRYSLPYIKRFGMEDPWSLENMEGYGITPDGLVKDIWAERLGLK